jgi:5-methylcytosine-specific restriction endonuclease McrA
VTTPRGRRYREARAAVLHGATHCTWCGTWIDDRLPVGHPHKATADHIVPVARGGLDHIDNLVPCCFRCNNRRRAHDPSVLRVDDGTPG